MSKWGVRARRGRAGKWIRIGPFDSYDKAQSERRAWMGSGYRAEVFAVGAGAKVRRKYDPRDW